MESQKKNEEATTNEEESSGFVAALPNDIEHIATDTPNVFTDIHECYRSTMGHTCLYSARRYGKNYMLKALKSDYSFIPIYKQLLKKEFELSLQLDHPHICRTISMENVQGLGSVIVMEYIDGETLQTLLQNGTPNKTLFRKIALQLASALEYLHSKQIVHRDIKPSNIMITHNGHNVKLIDFSLSDSDSYNILKTPAGTSGYIAPEQLIPDAVTDTRSDIYSYGKVLYEMGVNANDRQLLHIASLCTRRNPDDRPTNIADISFSYRPKTWVIALCVILTAAIVILIGDIIYEVYIHFYKAVSPHPELIIPSGGDGNRVGV